MNSNHGGTVEGASQSSPLDSTLQNSLVQTLPDLLFLLADTREQLEQARAEAAQAEEEVEASVQAHTRLLTLVAGLQDDLKRISQENSELSDQLASVETSNHTLEERIGELEADCRRQAEVARQAHLQAAVAEDQLREIRESRSWRAAEPFRRAGAVVKRLRGGTTP